MAWQAPNYGRWGDTPAEYEPEAWDVVRDDGLRLITGTTILDADTQVAYLNSKRPGGHTYSTESGDPS